MKTEIVAVPVFRDRISPLLDVSNRFMIFEIVKDEIVRRQEIDIREDCAGRTAELLRDLGVSVIIGSAVSGFVSRKIDGCGIRLLSWVNGEVGDVIARYIRGEITAPDRGEERCGRGGGAGRCAGGRAGRRHGGGKKGGRNENSGDE